ncbi:hypothetical protein [Thermomonospora echinospora]|uniref:hypothetical protein n=1 Tax=Thermomonospora echinospora TaxID=1992 RepID=UPI00135B6DD6|nr:hypothetical protein [Thermomonospora echinospora]
MITSDFRARHIGTDGDVTASRRKVRVTTALSAPHGLVAFSGRFVAFECAATDVLAFHSGSAAGTVNTMPDGPVSP